MVVLAGWMRTGCRADPFRPVSSTSPGAARTFPAPIIQRAFAAYRRGEIDHTGVMVHPPDPAVDAGPVVASVPFGRAIPSRPEARIPCNELLRRLRELLCGVPAVGPAPAIRG